MITDSFLNSCFSLILCKNSKIKNPKILYRDILEIINFYEKKESLSIPLSYKNKVDCITKICSMLIENKTINNVIDSISFSDKFKQYSDFLDLKINEELNMSELQDIIRQIRLRKKINGLFENYDELNNVLDSIKDGSFDAIDDLINDYETTIKTLYSNMMESNRTATIESTSSLDLISDDYDNAIEMIIKKYDRSNKTPTGFPIFDNSILMGGFDPSRLYVFGGASSAGKSTILNNLINKSALSNQPKSDSNEIENVYIYITLENTIEESLLRTYQPIFDKTLNQVLQEISSGVNIKQKVQDVLHQHNSTIVMKYFPATSISPIDIMGIIDDIIDTYGKEKIKGVYIDYLDLLKTDTKYDMYRIELGHITLSLKTLAVQYNLPFITATQLGRSAYRVQESNELNLDQISESIKKVEHADFVMLLSKDPVNDYLVHGKIGKNRSGKANISLDFNVDFEKFKFISGGLASNKKKPNATTPVELMKVNTGNARQGF